MGEPLGLINANDPKYRDRFSRIVDSPSGAAEGARVADAAAGASGSDAKPSAAVRQFRGFDRERSTYLRLKLDLLATAQGQFVVIVGEDVEGPVATFGDAERAGYRRFGFGPLYIKQVLVEEPVGEVSRDINSCRP